MITRFALFEGTIHAGMTDAFRVAVTTRLVPLWRQFPGNTDVRVSFGTDRDAGAPEFPLVLAITYPSMAVMEQALTNAVRAQSRDETGRITAQYFTGRIHHHVTDATEYRP